MAKVYGISMRGDQFPDIPLLGDEDDGPLVSVERAAHMLGGITRREITNMRIRGEIETVKLGRRRMVVTESIYELVKRLREESKEAVAA